MKAVIFGALLAALAISASAGEDNSSGEYFIYPKGRAPQSETAWHIIKNESGKVVLSNDTYDNSAYAALNTNAKPSHNWVENALSWLDDGAKPYVQRYPLYADTDEGKQQAEYERQLAKKPAAVIGMTKSQVRNKTNWGEPKYINTTTNRYGTHEQWVYDDYQYLYFDNGKLTTIQQ